jgi:hypothetical protein
MTRRSILVSIAPLLMLGGPLASAAPHAAAGVPPISCPLPADCQPLAVIPASAKIPGPALAAHISVASCLAEHAMSSASVSGDHASVKRLDAAVQPSIAMLDEVIATGDPYWQLIAKDAQRDIYTSMIVRERTASSGTPEARAQLEPLLAPWQADAQHRVAEMQNLLRTNPELARRDQVASHVAGEVKRVASR